MRIFRCHDCVVNEPMCSQCLLAMHAYEPFHWGEVWTGSCFKKIDLSRIGKKILLGHGGQCCPANIGDNMATVKLTIIDCNGVHNCMVVYCRCIEGAGPYSEVMQLLSSRLFPYTTNKPETAVTFRCLEDFRIHTNASRKSAYDYMKALYAVTCEDTMLRLSVRNVLHHLQH